MLVEPLSVLHSRPEVGNFMLCLCKFGKPAKVHAFQALVIFPTYHNKMCF